jgi:hypothetical protein
MADISVAMTRKALQLIRRAWAQSLPSSPFDPTCTLDGAEMPTVSYDKLAYRFVQNHALKRHRKGSSIGR